MELLTSTGADLSFVHLGITIEHLRNSISIFGFRIAFYGIIIGCGMLAGMAVAFSDAKRRGQDPDLYMDFALYGIIFSIIGARLYYVIFEWDNYKNDLLQIFNLRAGGLAIYGGVIGAVLTLLIFTKVRKQSFFSMADSGVLGLITGQLIRTQAFDPHSSQTISQEINPQHFTVKFLSLPIPEHKCQYAQVPAGLIKKGGVYLDVFYTIFHDLMF